MIKTKILMVCSWMNHSSSSFGMVFREQAKVVNDYFDFTFLTFKKIGIKDSIRHRKFIFLEKIEVPENNEKFVYCNYLHSGFFPEFLNDYSERLSIKFVKSRLENDGFQLIHAQSLIEGGFFSHYLSKSLGIPYMITEHAQLNFTGVSHKRHALYQKVLDEAHSRLVVSNDKIRQYAMNRLHGSFINIGNLVDEKIFHYTEKIRDSNRIKLITVGAYSKIKDQITLLKALKIFEKSWGKTKIDFCWIGYNGWGIDNDALVRQLIDSIDFQSISVKLIPLASRESVAFELNDSDLFLFSSISEGMPLAIMEALACGLPVVTTKCGGVEEIIENDNGFCVDIRDFYDLAKKISFFFENRNRFDKLKISKKAISIFGSQSFSEKIKLEYSKILNEK